MKARYVHSPQLISALQLRLELHYRFCVVETGNYRLSVPPSAALEATEMCAAHTNESLLLDKAEGYMHVSSRIYSFGFYTYNHASKRACVCSCHLHPLHWADKTLHSCPVMNVNGSLSLPVP